MSDSRIEMNGIDKDNTPKTIDDSELARQVMPVLQPAHRSLTQEEKDLMWMNVYRKCQDAKPDVKIAHKRLYLWLSGAAVACIAVATGIVSVYRQDLEKQNSIAENLIENVVRPDCEGNDIQIILADDEKIALKEQEAEIVYDESGKVCIGSREDILPANTEMQQEKENKQVEYNQIVVPKGKRSTLTLSDGSKLSLNSFSRVVYPPVFADNQREIYIEGEVYIDVKPDRERPFILKTSQMEIRVTGTSFNVMAYEDEAVQEVVLAEGSISVRVKGTSPKEIILHPGQKFSLTGQEIAVKTVDTENYISWKDGYYLSKYGKLSLILNRLSRYYGVEIRYGREVGELRFAGKLDLKDDPDRVIFGFQNTSPVECRKENGIYIINYLK
jgi:hypothetical protein